jgi:hypothetical protein
VIERLDDGRPGAEEAWAMVPKDEEESAVITGEMRFAMGVALRLLADGDAIASGDTSKPAIRGRLKTGHRERCPDVLVGVTG